MPMKNYMKKYSTTHMSMHTPNTPPLIFFFEINKIIILLDEIFSFKNGFFENCAPTISVHEAWRSRKTTDTITTSTNSLVSTQRKVRNTMAERSEFKTSIF